MAQIGNEFIWECTKCGKSLQYEQGINLAGCDNKDWYLGSENYALCNLCSYDFIEWMGLKNKDKG